MILCKLRISEQKSIEILSQNENGDIFLFDEIKIIYHKEEENQVLFDDFLCEGMRALQNVSQKALSGELEIQEKYFEKGIGYEWNKISNRIANDEFDIVDITSPYALWSTPSGFSNSTWIYCFNGEIYLEISPQYKWNYCEPEENELFMNFEDFKSSYQVYDRVKITREEMMLWNDMSNEIVSKMKE